MARTAFKRRIIEDIEGLPENKIREVIDFINFLKLKEEDWFIDFVNKRGAVTESERKMGRKFMKIKELQQEYQ